MHFNFDFTAVQILWTLTFASLLVLLVVLHGTGSDMAISLVHGEHHACCSCGCFATAFFMTGCPKSRWGQPLSSMADVSALVGLIVCARWRGALSAA